MYEEEPVLTQKEIMHQMCMQKFLMNKIMILALKKIKVNNLPK